MSKELLKEVVESLVDEKTIKDIIEEKVSCLLEEKFEHAIRNKARELANLISKEKVAEMVEKLFLKEIVVNDGWNEPKKYGTFEELVKALSDVYIKMKYADIDHIELRKYRNKKTEQEHEFVILYWLGGTYSTAPNDINSLSATARNIARMLDGGVYENIDFYKEIMASEEWELC